MSEQPLNFGDARKQAEREGIIPGGFFKVQDGSNRIRLVSRPLPDPQFIDGERRFKWLCLVIDRRDGQVKPDGMPHRVYKEIEKLQNSEDYAFTSVPMPYDLDIQVENAGKITARYSVIAARKNTPLTAEETDAVTEKGDIAEIQKALRSKSEQKFDPDEVPL